MLRNNEHVSRGESEKGASLLIYTFYTFLLSLLGLAI